MGLNLPKKIWVYAERLYIHAHDAEKFKVLLKNYGIEYGGAPYGEFENTKSRYGFMSEENYTFANFMQAVPTYKYLRVLEAIVFDPEVVVTAQDNWNYYGEFISNWYPKVVELLGLAEVGIDPAQKKLIYEEAGDSKSESDFLPYAFNDPFLDYLRKEINESYRNNLYLSVMFLSRKVLEVVFIRIMEVVFPKQSAGKYNKGNHELWFDVRRNGYRNFGELITNLKENSSAFQEDKQLVLELCALVKPFKDETNSCVHDDYKIPDASYVRDWRASQIVTLSRKVFRKYCNP